MPIYVTLVKTPAEGMKRMPDFAEAHEEVHKIAEQMGIKTIGAYALLGPYDMMFIYEAPDEKVAISPVLSQLVRRGGQAETWAAIPMGEFAELTARLKG